MSPSRFYSASLIYLHSTAFSENKLLSTPMSTVLLLILAIFSEIKGINNNKIN